MTLAQHIVIRPRDNRALFTQPAVRRLFSRTVARIGRSFELIGWGAGDNHGHMGNHGGDEPKARELARRVEVSLAKRLGDGLRFEEASVRPVNDQYHLEQTVPYMHRQAERHGVNDPFHEGTSLPDALGRRVLAPDLPGRLALVAPRLRLKQPHPLGELPDDPAILARAAAMAIGTDTLTGKSPLVLDARRAVIHLAHRASTAELIRAMGGTRRSLSRLRKRPLPDQAFLDAVAAQARWLAGATPTPT